MQNALSQRFNERYYHLLALDDVPDETQATLLLRRELKRVMLKAHKQLKKSGFHKVDVGASGEDYVLQIWRDGMNCFKFTVGALSSPDRSRNIYKINALQGRSAVAYDPASEDQDRSKQTENAANFVARHCVDELALLAACSRLRSKASAPSVMPAAKP